MRCQMPGCKNQGINKSTGEGIFCGIHIDQISIYTCGNHAEKDIEKELSKKGERIVYEIQAVNPFAMTPKVKK